jgi:hypothetical protein
MWSRKLTKLISPAVLVLPLMLVSAAAWSDGEQILEEVAVAGQDADGEGAIDRPDFDSPNPTSTNWVPGAAGRDIRGFAMSVTGSGLWQDGTMIQEFTSSGAPGNIQFDCTTQPFNAPKKNGTPQQVMLSDCHSFTPKNDGSILIAGAVKGTRFVLVRHVPDPDNPGTGDTTLLADGTPPIISDMDSDESADAGDRLGLGTYAIGERKKLLFFPQGSEQNWSVISTLNGVRIDAVTPFKDWVIVVLDDGELLSIDPTTGVATPFETQNPGALCDLGRKDPQKFSARATPLGRLYVGSFGCQNVAIYDDMLNLLPYPTTTLADNPFDLDFPVFSPVALDWRSGQGGDWGACIGDTVGEGCTYSQQQNGARAFGVTTRAGLPTSFRMFQFNLQDCRHARESYPDGPFVRPCPIVNCASAYPPGEGCLEEDPNKQVLNLSKMLIDADQSGEFAQAASLDLDNPMTLPGYVRGEEYHPGSMVFNDYVFYSFFAITDTIFEDVFFTQYDIDILRLPIVSNDLCTVPGSEQTVDAMNEFANLIVYNRSDHDTIDRGADEGTRGGTVINEFCNRGRAAAYEWSAQSVGLEFHNTNEDAYLRFTELQLDELEDAKDELLCDTFTVAGTVVGPLLSGGECDLIQSHINQIRTKQGVCHDALLTVQQGSSHENCNALRTKIDNLEIVLDDPLLIDWPDALHPDAPAILAPNYEGEFRGRILSYEWATFEWLLNAVPPGGITP